MENVNQIESETMYTATLEFRSMGTGPEVQPRFTFSHNFPENYAGQYPAAYLAARDIAIMLSLEKHTVINTEFDLPEDPDERARLAINAAQAEKSSVN